MRAVLPLGRVHCFLQWLIRVYVPWMGLAKDLQLASEAENDRPSAARLGARRTVTRKPGSNLFIQNPDYLGRLSYLNREAQKT